MLWSFPSALPNNPSQQPCWARVALRTSPHSLTLRAAPHTRVSLHTVESGCLHGPCAWSLLSFPLESRGRGAASVPTSRTAQRALPTTGNHHPLQRQAAQTTLGHTLCPAPASPQPHPSLSAGPPEQCLGTEGLWLSKPGSEWWPRHTEQKQFQRLRAGWSPCALCTPCGDTSLREQCASNPGQSGFI